jgi:hypothetical protein
MTKSQALPTWLDRLGDWNPQLLRELKGRLNWRSVLITVALVAIVQVLFMMNFLQQLPNNTNSYTPYCLLRSGPKNICQGVNWALWWRDVFGMLNWAIGYAVYLPAVYFLISDLNQEIQRGTVNFLRLSPRSANTILMGKILGVPVLSYLTGLLGMPLHLWVGFQAGVTSEFFLSYYASLLICGGVVLCCALLIGCRIGTDRNTASPKLFSSSLILGMGLVGAVLVPVLWNWNLWILWNPFLSAVNQRIPGEMIPRPVDRIDWFFIPFNQNLWFPHLLTWTNLIMVSALLWRMLQRGYSNPKTTLISKHMSYFMTPYFIILILGFGFGFQNRQFDIGLVSTLTALLILLPWGFMGLIGALSSQRQTWLDWIRYRESIANTQSNPKLRRIQLIRDLVWGEKSPGLTAIAINLVMATGILVAALLFVRSSSAENFPSHMSPLPILSAITLGIVLNLTIVTTYTLLVQWMLLLKTRKRSTWALGSLSFVAVIPLIIGFYNLAIGTITSWFRVVMMCSPGFQVVMMLRNMRFEGEAASVVETASIALVIQSIAILFLASRVWSEWRKMSRST